MSGVGEEGSEAATMGREKTCRTSMASASRARRCRIDIAAKTRPTATAALEKPACGRTVSPPFMDMVVARIERLKCTPVEMQTAQIADTSAANERISHDVWLFDAAAPRMKQTLRIKGFRRASMSPGV